MYSVQSLNYKGFVMNPTQLKVLTEQPIAKYNRLLLYMHLPCVLPIFQVRAFFNI